MKRWLRAMVLLESLGGHGAPGPTGMSVQDGVRISGQAVRYPWAGGPLERAAGEENFTQKGPAQGILPWKAQKQTKLAAAALSSRTASSACPPSSWCWCWRCWLACCRRRANSLAGILLPRATAPVSITCARTTCTPCHHDVLADLHSAAGTSAQSPAAERRLTLTTPAIYLGRKRWIQKS